MESVNGTVAINPAELVKRTLVVYTAALSVFAAAARLAVTVNCPSPAREPFVAENASHVAVLIRLHFAGLLRLLDRTNDSAFGANGPPTGPMAVNPCGDEMDIGCWTCRVIGMSGRPARSGL